MVSPAAKNCAGQLGDWLRLFPADLQRVITILAEDHRVVGPQLADGAVVYRDLADVVQLPTGWIDEQDGGSYRLRQEAAAGSFDHVVGPHSLKNFLFPALDTVASFVRTEGEWKQEPVPADERPLAVLGVRACDMAALRIQDKVFLGSGYIDPAYKARRERLFTVAVNCRRAAATCFCHSMNCGPKVAPGFDLSLTERDGWFACQIGSAAGLALFQRLAAAGMVLTSCTAPEIDAAEKVSADLEASMHARQPVENSPRPRSLDTTGIRDLLYANPEHPRWEEVATRCLSCTNCTLVCPTCFCSSVTEVADLSGDHVERQRHWASCFTLDHSRMHGGSVRNSTSSRYRQWLTHKLAGWIDQFDSSGCTGCGRCIAWCPVGIDLTEEVAALRHSPPP